MLQINPNVNYRKFKKRKNKRKLVNSRKISGIIMSKAKSIFLERKKRSQRWSQRMMENKW
jgi:hypothetical protein